MAKIAIITGGGTGGHIYPALAIANIVDEIGVDNIIYIGNRDKMEYNILKDYPYEFFSIPMIGMPRKINVKMIKFIAMLFVSIIKVLPLFIVDKPRVVIGTGGFVTFPALLVGKLFGSKIIIQEQNTIPGVVNKFAGKFADSILLGFEDASKYFKANKCVHVGNPVKKATPKNSESVAALSRFLAVNEDDILKTVQERYTKTVLVFGGSLGAKKINSLTDNFIKNNSDYIRDNRILVVWLTGKSETYTIDNKLEHNVLPLNYTNDIELIYKFTDTVISRSGAMTVFELYKNKLPSLLIPFPYATGDHQYHNALFLENKGVAKVVREELFTDEIFADSVKELLGNDSFKKRFGDVKDMDSEAIIKQIIKVELK